MKSLTRALLVIAAAAAPAVALAQAYPAKPVRILIPFPAGSINDILARQVADKLTPALGQPVIAENRIGAGGRIAATAAAKAPADGYTLLLGSASTHVVAPQIVKNMPYDPVRDFTPIANAASPATGLVVNAELPVTTVRELVDYARKNPGKISFASNGIGSTHQLRGEFIKAAVETNADAIMVSSLYGQGELDCRGFRDLCVEAGLDDILLYVGGNLVVGKQPWPEVEDRFLAMGFDRAAPPGTRIEAVIEWLARDFAARERGLRRAEA